MGEKQGRRYVRSGPAVVTPPMLRPGERVEYGRAT
jgi:hypothetical protein